MRKPGRTSRLTPDLIEGFRRYLLLGNTLDNAARLNAVGPRTMYRWRAEGKAVHHGHTTLHLPTCPGTACSCPPISEPELKRQFWQATEDSTAQVEARLVASIEIAGRKKDWRAAAWLLERRNRQDWGPKASVEHTGPGGGPVVVALEARRRLQKAFPDQPVEVES